MARGVNVLLKPIIEVYPVVPAKSEEERAALRPIGRNVERYQDALMGACEIVKHADEIGFWGAAAIEHHFHSEGYEAAPVPGILNAYWAALTKRLHLGQLGYVLGTHNPIRVAEETAMLSHLTQGRSFVGLARGYQSRWTGILGQHYGSRPTKSPDADFNQAAQAAGFTQTAIAQKDYDDDAINRALFEEHVDVMLKAWTQPSFHHKGRNWQVPFPFEAGIADWPLAKAGVTQKFGAQGEVDETGVIRAVSVAPAPYQKPHPPVFVSGSGTPATIEYTARMGFHPVYFCNIETSERLAKIYLTTSRQSGFDVRYGEKQAMVRWIYIGRTDDEARRLAEEYDAEIWKNFYGAMGRRAAVANPMQSAFSTGLICAGSVETVRKELVRQFMLVPAEHLVFVTHYAMTPMDFVQENMSLFIEKVKPAIDEVLHKHHKKVPLAI